MPSTLGVDPGKVGAFCLLDPTGRRVKFWDMPITADKICGVGIAQVYNEVRSICSEPPVVYIEKIFTMPTDAVRQSDYDYARRLCDFLQDGTSNGSSGAVAKFVRSLNFSGTFTTNNIENGTGDDADCPTSAVLVELARFLATLGRPPTLPPVRLDGRVGNLNYAHGAGLLEMVHLWNWPIVRVPPKTWTSILHKGLPKNLEPKDRSRLYVSERFPELYKKGSELWPARMKNPHLGRLDALMLAVYGRSLTV